MKITSEMDTSKILTDKTGCVTIFSRNQGHAEILIESIKNGKKYTVKAHFTGEVSGRVTGKGVYHTGIGRVKVKVLNSPLKYVSKSETWESSSDKIRSLIEDAEFQSTYDQNFSILGNDSIFEIKNWYLTHTFRLMFSQDYVQLPYHNCMSWAKEILQKDLDLELNCNALDFFITATPLHLKKL